MPVPKRKKSRSRRDMRRSQHEFMGLAHANVCDNCGADVQSHRVCGSCGYYRGAVRIEMPTAVEELPAEA